MPPKLPGSRFELNNPDKNPPQKTDPDAPPDKIGDNYVSLGVLLKTGSFSDVEVVISSIKRSIKLHKAVLCQNSGYFRAMFKSDSFKEGKESRVVLSDISEGDLLDVVHWLYYGAFRPPPEPSKPWGISRSAMMIKNSLYFDIPSLKKAALELFVVALSFYSTYYKSPKGSTIFVDAFKVIFELYGTQAESLDPIFKAMTREKFVPEVLRNDELRPLLDDEPKLTARLLEIQYGLEPWKPANADDDLLMDEK